MSTTFSHRKKNILTFFPTPKIFTMPAVGIDISDSSVKFLRLQDGENGKEIELYGEKEIPANVVLNGEIKNPDALIQVLSMIQKENDIHFIRASLPEEEAYIFKTLVPKGLKDGEVKNLIDLKLEENVPLASGEAVFDYDIPLKEDSSIQQREVSVTVYPNKTIEQYTEVFRKAHLTPLSFEIEAQAIARAVVQKGDDGTYMIVDFGKMRTGIAVVSNGLLSFASTLDVVGDTLTEAVAEHFSVSILEAEKIKNESDFIQNKDNSELFETLMVTISRLKDEIERHFRYWNSRTDKKGKKVPQIEKIILCGGSSNVVGLREYLSGSLEARAERANVWKNVFSFNETIPNIVYEQSLGYATAVGLALRSGF